MNSMRLTSLHSCASSVHGPAEPVNPLTPVNWTSAWRTITASHQPRKLKMLLISGNKWILIMQVRPNWSPSLWKFPVTSAWSKRRKYEDLSHWRLFYTLECSCGIGLRKNLEEEWNSFIYTLSIFFSNLQGLGLVPPEPYTGPQSRVFIYFRYIFVIAGGWSENIIYSSP